MDDIKKKILMEDLRNFIEAKELDYEFGFESNAMTEFVIATLENSSELMNRKLR